MAERCTDMAARDRRVIERTFVNLSPSKAMGNMHSEVFQLRKP